MRGRACSIAPSGCGDWHADSVGLLWHVSLTWPRPADGRHRPSVRNQVTSVCLSTSCIHLDVHDYMCMSSQNHSSICDFSTSIDCHSKHWSQALTGSGNRLMQIKVKYCTMKVWLKPKIYETRKLNCRKDDRAMRAAAYTWVPWKLSTVYLFTPMANFPDILMGFFRMNPMTIPAQIWSP